MLFYEALDSSRRYKHVEEYLRGSAECRFIRE